MIKETHHGVNTVEGQSGLINGGCSGKGKGFEAESCF